MKNIHILPTSQPSRLAKLGMSDKLQLFDNLISFKTFEKSPQNICITNNEEIKEDNYAIALDTNTIFKVSKHDLKGIETFQYLYKKIILTTDQDLIKDGVQPIPDEFLEWFVKNPSCEKVEIYQDKKDYGSFQWYSEYKIIIPRKENCICEVGRPYNNLCCKVHGSIPQEEPNWGELKNSGLDKPFKLIEEPKSKLTNQKYLDKMKTDGVTEEFKQETLEEACKRIEKELDYSEFDYTSFKLGIKYQQEQDKNKYSEEEVLAILKERDLHNCINMNGNNSWVDRPKWFEKFKKK
jgi:hypothetical protein